MNCRHHPTCPGCPLMGKPYDRQLRIKHKRLNRAFSLYPHLPEVEEILPALHTDAYRHRLKLPVFVSGERVNIGLYERPTGPHGHKGPSRRHVLHTPDCPVLADGLRQALPAMEEWLRGRRDIHSIDLRISDATGELQLVLATRDGDLEGGKRAIRRLERLLPQLKSVAISQADMDRKRVMGKDPRPFTGRRTIDEAIGETRYVLHPGAFFQADPRNATQIHELVRTMVGPASRVLDLFAGVGAYGRMLAPWVDEVLAVEEVPAAAASAAENAPQNFEVLTGKVQNLDDEDLDADIAILNPARRGATPDILKRLAERLDRLVYVSCGPETLARDLDVLAAYGLRVDRAVAVDLFPQTREVETVVHLTRGKPVTAFPAYRGKATGPWRDRPSGALGRVDEMIVMIVGQMHGKRLHNARWHHLGTVASHAVLRLELRASPQHVLSELTAKGHPIAGADPKTRRFFAEKGGLVRPFVHYTRAGETRSRLHGDLLQTLFSLRAERDLMERLMR